MQRQKNSGGQSDGSKHGDLSFKTYHYGIRIGVEKAYIMHTHTKKEIEGSTELALLQLPLNKGTG